MTREEKLAAYAENIRQQNQISLMILKKEKELEAVRREEQYLRSLRPSN